MTTIQEYNDLEYTIEDQIEEFEYELKEAKELKTKAVEDNHKELIKTANSQIVIAEAKLWQVRHKRNLTLPMEYFTRD
jgi:hypothetical protein